MWELPAMSLSELGVDGCAHAIVLDSHSQTHANTPWGASEGKSP